MPNTSIQTLPATRVVVVEDDASMRDLISRHVQDTAGFMLTAALATKAEAIQWIKRHPVDLLLTDLGLPDGSGVDVIRVCSDVHPDCHILVISMFGEEAAILAAIDAGARGYILKNTGPLDVARFFQDLQQGGSPMSPLIARKLLLRAMSPDTIVAQEPAKPVPAGLSELTRREYQALSLVARGYAYAEVAEKMHISISTVQSHLKSTYSKLSVHSSRAAIFKAHQLGIFKTHTNRVSGKWAK